MRDVEEQEEEEEGGETNRGNIGIKMMEIPDMSFGLSVFNCADMLLRQQVCYSHSVMALSPGTHAEITANKSR